MQKTYFLRNSPEAFSKNILLLYLLKTDLISIIMKLSILLGKSKY